MKRREPDQLAARWTRREENFLGQDKTSLRSFFLLRNELLRERKVEPPHSVLPFLSSRLTKEETSLFDMTSRPLHLLLLRNSGEDVGAVLPGDLIVLTASYRYSITLMSSSRS
jgi:hypothetical protein